MPKTPGNDDAFKLYDPARVSHISVSLSVRHPSGVAGSLAMPDPRVIGATPLDRVAKKRAPTRGACLHPFTTGACPRRPFPTSADPDRPCPTGADPDRPFPTDACSDRLCPPGGGTRGDDFTPTDGSRLGSTLHSHRSSRDSGEDLWPDRRSDFDPLRVAEPIS